MTERLLPKNVRRLERGETFNFACHPAVACFTECCRKLELALTPYDVLRLKKACGLSSEEFLDRHVIIEQEEYEPFPRFYLTMVDDGRESCVFVTKAGCTVYPDRPGACRAYPMGRAAIRQEDGRMEEFYVIVQEGHCRGFDQQQEKNTDHYGAEQELAPYNRFNDAVAVILQHDQIRRGKQLSLEEVERFVLALYNLDQFRTLLLAGALPMTTPLDSAERQRLLDDEELLLFAIDWLKDILFNR